MELRPCDDGCDSYLKDASGVEMEGKMKAGNEGISNYQ